MPKPLTQPSTASGGPGNRAYQFYRGLKGRNKITVFTPNVSHFQCEEICSGTFTWGCALRAPPQAVISRAFSPALRIVLLCGACAILGCSGPRGPMREIRATCQPVEMEEALNALRNDINARYGFRDGTPRVNLGPCGRFARDFCARWNARFREPVTIAFIMSNDGMTCHHVLVKLPDGRYCDGGNGVVTDTSLMRLFSESRIEEMKDFDLKLLDQRSYGLARTYPECPNYSDRFTQQAIEKRLDALLNHRRPE